MERHTQSVLVLLVAATTLGGGVLVGLGGIGALAQEEGADASITIEDQPSDGETVIVDSVTLPEGGFVVIHDEGLADGDAVGSVIGVSRHLEAGTHEDVPVTVAPEFDTTVVEVTAMAHQDGNENGVFDFVLSDGGLDGPYTAAAGNETDGNATEGNETDGNATESGPVVDSAMIDATGSGVPSTGLTFEDQASDGTNLTVQNVTLYRGGYVVIHDASLQEDGDAIGSVIGHSAYLAPGTYESVNVSLARPLDLENESSVNVTAMPHHETNGNLVYDFVTSTGDADGPYLDANDSAVIETATISSGDGNESVPTETTTAEPTTENGTSTAEPTTEGETTTEAAATG